MRTVGLCRFSCVGRGGFQNGRDNQTDVAAYLFDDARIEERFLLFEAITLPSVAAQTDPDFTFLIVTGKWLPPQHLKRLQDLTAHVPQCVIKQFPPRPHRKIMAKAINNWRGPLTHHACNSGWTTMMQWH